MKKYKIGAVVSLPSGVGLSIVVKLVFLLIRKGRIIMTKFKTGENVALPESKYPGVPGVVISYNNKTEKYLVRFNGIQQMYFSEDELTVWDKK